MVLVNSEQKYAAAGGVSKVPRTVSGTGQGRRWVELPRSRLIAGLEPRRLAARPRRPGRESRDGANGAALGFVSGFRDGRKPRTRPAE